MTVPTPTNTPRAQALAAWRQVENASMQLERLLSTSQVDLDQVALLLEQGATPRLATHSWFDRIVSEDNQGLAKTLLPVFDELHDNERNAMLRQAARKGSEAMMRVMLVPACMRQSPKTLFLALIEAVEADRAGIARLLLEAGAPVGHPLPQEADDAYNRLGARLKSVAMLDLLCAHGWQPNTTDLFDAMVGRCIGHTEEEAPRVEIVERLLDMGVPASHQEHLAKPWAVLMRTPSKQLEFHDKQLACARLLIQAQAPVDIHRLSLPAAWIMLEAGLEPRQVMELWQVSRGKAIECSDFFPPGDKQALSVDKWMRKARDVLLAIDGNGLPLEQLKQAKSMDRDFRYALAAAGCQMEPKELVGVPETYLQWREQSILERHTAPAMGTPRGPRL